MLGFGGALCEQGNAGGAAGGGGTGGAWSGVKWVSGLRGEGDDPSEPQ